MPPSHSPLYRQEAIEFQRRRLAGEIRLMPERPLLAWSGLMLVLFAAFCSITWMWSIPVSRVFACDYRQNNSGNGSVTVSSIPDNSTLEHAELISPSIRSIALNDVTITKVPTNDAQCKINLSLRVYPLKEAVYRALRH
jgi:methionine-rich copper-binding protein CopC